MSDRAGGVLLASYPKSGNTWLRALLTAYLSDGDVECEINHLRGHLIASSRRWFEDETGLNSSELLPAEIEGLRTRIYRRLAAAPLTFVKVHDACRTATGHQLFPSDAGLVVVYVIRDPLDVAVSYAHHYGKTFQWACEAMCDRRNTLAATPDKFHDQLPQYLGSWSDHVESWEQSGISIHVIRYEDLVASPLDTFASVLVQLGVPVIPGRLRAAVDASSFDRLRAQEVRTGFSERPSTAAGHFFRKGRVGSGRHELQTEQIERLTVHHHATMKRHGYL